MKDKNLAKSHFQYEITKIVKKKYPLDPICCDITLPNSRLSLDILLPLRALAIEAHGIQHYSRSSFYHKTYRDFLTQRDRDEKKKYFCDINNIILVEVASIEEIESYLNNV